TLGDRSAVPALVEVIRNRDGFFLPVVRRAAVLALVHLGGPAAIAMLEAVAANAEEDPVVRQAAVGQAA
ncbi:MAG TPA: HEAT repeat domain-containing protein, partial [Humisphaera sp.]